MGINNLQREAFIASPEFTNQVNAIVVREALYRNDTWPNIDANTRSILSQVARAPGHFGFPSTIVSDITWDVSFDTWAEDPPEAEQRIEGGVQKYWQLLTGITPPPA